MKARIENNVAVDVHATPEMAFHPDIAAQFVDVPAQVRAGWVRDDSGKWSAPTAASPPTHRTEVMRTEYYGLFSAAEEAMIRVTAKEEVTPPLIKAARDAGNAAEEQRLMAVAALSVMLRRIDGLAASNTIDLANPQVVEGLGLLVQMGLLTAARRDEIARGVAL